MEPSARPGIRALAGAGAFVVGAYFGVLVPSAMLRQGYVLTAVSLATSAALLTLFLAWLAASPGTLQPVLSRYTRLDLRDPAHAGAAVLMAGTLFLVIGYGSLASGALAYERVQAGKEDLGEVDGDLLFEGLVVNLAVLILPPFLYCAYVQGGGPAGALRHLGLRAEGAGLALAQGAALGLGALFVLLLVGAALTTLPIEVPENERALAIARSVTILGAFGLAAGAAVSEEIFFRGFLQPRIGLWGQAGVFALAHLSYVNVLEVVVVFVLALGFGLLYRRTGNLWGPIAGHFVFNLVMLVLGICSEPGACGIPAPPP